jgi:hypothetical protein
MVPAGEPQAVGRRVTQYEIPQEEIMEREQTLKILNALAHGIHPGTGEQFPAASPYQHPDAVRALFEAMRAVESRGAAAQPRPEEAASLPGNTGLRWTPEEEEQLAAAFDAGRSVTELARAHNRTRAAIEARLVRIGKLDAAAVTTQFRYPPRPSGRQAGQGDRNPSQKSPNTTEAADERR